MKRGDIYKVALDPVLGREQKGVRPVLIVSPTIFNRKTGTPIVVPITNGGNYARENSFTVSLMGAGTETTGVILCHQMRSLDLKSRNAQRIESVPSSIIEDVLSQLVPLFDPD
ncbi:MAG: type II toxin-antitoxin system PemK/MazF family toxin [Methylobacter sp.]|nr:type II toxin-antitoxin system PemK/MazF family toxin [Methylobacter sp.]